MNTYGACGLFAFLTFIAPGAMARDGEGLSDMRRARARKASSEEPSTPEAAKTGEGPKETPVWDLGVFGYLRVGYENVQRDDRYTFVGANNGFILESARVGFEAIHRPYNLTFRISAEGASDVQTGLNTPLGLLDFRLRDAFVRYDPWSFIGIALGQLKAPFAEEELRGTQDLLFASRAVGQEGVLVGRGFQQPGIALDRQLGLMISPQKAIKIAGDVHAAYYAMVMNGNGVNQMLDDNAKLGVVGRAELGYGEYVRIGAGAYYNPRTVGTPPNYYEENDVGLAADVALKFRGFEALGQFAQVRTTFPTVNSQAQTKLAFHLQAGYEIALPHIGITPAYRYAHYHPWSGTGNVNGQDYTAFRLDYHTVGLRLRGEKLPLSLWANYTFTVEPDARKLANNRLEILAQVVF